FCWWWLLRLSLLWSSLPVSGAGSFFLLALSSFGIREPTTSQAASLAGIAQFVGYLLAATGPSLMRAFYDWTHSWVPMVVFCLVVASIMLTFGLAAGRDVKI